MKWVFIGLGVILGLLILATLVLPIYLLLNQPLPANNWLVGVRDAAIIYATMFMCVGAILFIVVTGLLAWIALLIRNRIVPAIEKVNDTAQTVRGTATFVSESVVAPIIKVAGAAAGTRAMVQTLMRQRPPKANGKEQKS